MALQDLIRVILPKEDHFFDYLEEQAKLAHEGAKMLATIEQAPLSEVKEKVHAIEKSGDKVNHQIEDALAKTFVTPIDREDIHKLSSMLDDILDRCHATTSAMDMFAIDTPSEQAIAFIRLLVKSTAKIAEVLPSLRKHDWDALRDATREMKTLEKEGDEIYRGAMRKLFSDTSIDARSLIREQEVIELLEDAIDTCEDVAEYLSNLSVKHG